MAYKFDVNMMAMLMSRSKHGKYFPQLTPAIVVESTYVILQDFDRYFREFKDHKKIDLMLFIPRMHNWHKSVGEDIMATRVQAVKAAAKIKITEEVENVLQTEIANAVLSTKMSQINDQYVDGDMPELGYAMSELVTDYKRNAGVAAEDWIADDIATLMADHDDTGGYNWRLQCLRNSMRGLRGGDFGIIAGRPDKGKTTFIASEITHLAGQVPKHRNILWLNNEGMGARIVPRLYQAALGCTRSELQAKVEAGTAKEEYAAVVGRTDKIRVADIHGMYCSKVEGLIEAHDAEIVVYDMIDNIRGFGDAARTDLALEQMYQWGRELAVKYHHAGLATSQISAEGDGEMYPSLSMLKDSKTGKQGACDFQIMIGASNDPALAGMRYIGLPKNKLRREGAAGDPREPVQFNPQIARYEDVQYGE